MPHPDDVLHLPPHPPAQLTPLHRNEEMAALALAIQEVPQMAAAVTHKKERPPSSETAPKS